MAGVVTGGSNRVVTERSSNNVIPINAFFKLIYTVVSGLANTNPLTIKECK